MERRRDGLRLVAEIEGHIRSASARLHELRRAILASDWSDVADVRPYECPRCNLDFATAERRDDHLTNVHGEGW